MPEEAVAELTEAPSEGSLPFQSDSFKELQKHMEQTLSGETPAPAKMEDTRPVQPAEVKKEPPKKELNKATPPDKRVPEKPAETAKEPEPDKEAPAFTSPSAANFKKIVAERDDWKKKATDHETAVKTHTEKSTALQKEYDEYKAKTSVKPDEIEAIKKERDTYAEQLNRHALSETPKFRDHYNSRFESAISRAVDAAGKEKSDQVKAVLEAPKSSWRKAALNELVAGMENEVDKLNLIAAVHEYDQSRDERSKALDDHKGQMRAWKESEQKRIEAETKAKEERLVTNRKAILAETLKQADKFEAFQEGDNPEHNLRVAKNKKLVQDFIMGGDDTLTDTLLAMLPVLASEGERLQKVVPTLQAKITELEEALAKYQGAAPELGGSGEPMAEGDKPKSFVDQVLDQWPGSIKQR